MVLSIGIVEVASPNAEADEIISSDPNLVCESYPDGIILCRDRKTGRRVQECRRLPDGRMICKAL